MLVPFQFSINVEPGGGEGWEFSLSGWLPQTQPEPGMLSWARYTHLFVLLGQEDPKDVKQAYFRCSEDEDKLKYTQPVSILVHFLFVFFLYVCRHISNHIS